MAGSYEMTTDLKVDGRIVIITVTGSINSISSPKLREMINQAYSNKIAGVILDLDQVNYIDSSGIATMIEGIQLAETNTSKFVLAGELDDKIKHMLEISRLDNLFEQYPSAEQAKTVLQ